MNDRPGSGPTITGHIDLVYPSAYLKFADLRGKDVTVIIDKVTMEDLIMAGGKRDRKACVHMRARSGKPLEKLWPVGKTVLKEIAATLREKRIEAWGGKAITMYPTTCKGKRKGEIMDCIRVRVRVDESGNAAEIPDDMAASPAPPPAFVDEAEGDETNAEGGAS